MGCPCLGTGRASLRVPEPPQRSHEVHTTGASVLQQIWVLGHAPVPVGSACWGGTSRGKPQPRERVVLRHVEPHPAPSMISLGVSGLCPGRVLPCRVPSGSAASASGLMASPEQGGERSQRSSWLSQLAPDGLCCPLGTCLCLATELLQHWQGCAHVGMPGMGWWDEGSPPPVALAGLVRFLLCSAGRAGCWQRPGDAEVGALGFPGQRGDLHQPAGGPLVGEHSPQTGQPL